LPLYRSQIVLAIAFAILVRLQCIGPEDAASLYESAHRLFVRGYLEQGQHFAEQGYTRSLMLRSTLRSGFQLLVAETMVWRGLDEEALRVLSTMRQTPGEASEAAIRSLTLASIAYTHLDRFGEAFNALGKADQICALRTYTSCGGVIRARGGLAFERGSFVEARRQYLESLSFAKSHRDQFLLATALLNLSTTALHVDHIDEALDWSQSAYQAAAQIDSEDLAEAARGNLGWAYFRLGDADRARALFLDAEANAAKLGDVRDQVRWTTTIGYVDMDAGETQSAEESYRKSLALASQIQSKEDITNALMCLAQVEIALGHPDQAESYAQRAISMTEQSGSRLDFLNSETVQVQSAAMRGDGTRAERLLREVESASESELSMKWTAEDAVAKLYEKQGNTARAQREFTSALTNFEAARAQLQHESSELPFAANATRIYDDYIHFLLSQGKTEEALLAADQSRARTLAQGLKEAESAGTPMQPQAVARKAAATLLFYWLGEKRSYLWAVTPEKIALFTLPAEAEIALRIQRYRKALLGLEDPLEAGNSDGRELYKILVAPAAELLRSNAPVMILADGALCRLNFETLIVPETAQPAKSNAAPHYWIEDAIVIAAPSLAMLAVARPAQGNSPKLLLLGDTVSPGDDYPELRWAGLEMSKIESHFPAPDEVVFARRQATPAAYLDSNPRQFAYIHFVSHGFASSTDPLDSAIILSRPNATEDSFKLYAREIMQHPIDARLVTISACNTSGTRSYAGEGLVGLSWAFLRAGAHNAIGALWEASDESTPRLMDRLYRGLQQGESPGEALRAAKLTLLHSGSRFRIPFYWAPFQLYTRM
jgi:CHAT domain-containing protein